MTCRWRFVPGSTHGHGCTGALQVGALSMALGWAFMHSHVVGLRAHVRLSSQSEANTQWSAVSMCQCGIEESLRTTGRRRNFPTGFSIETMVPDCGGWHTCNVCSTFSSIS
jgi:hypothetical protein